MSCTHCARRLKHAVMVNGEPYGETCAMNLFGAKREETGKNGNRVKRDTLTRELFA